jgi:hypothetical protein
MVSSIVETCGPSYPSSSPSAFSPSFGCIGTPMPPNDDEKLRGTMTRNKMDDEEYEKHEEDSDSQGVRYPSVG